MIGNRDVVGHTRLFSLPSVLISGSSDLCALPWGICFTHIVNIASKNHHPHELEKTQIHPSKVFALPLGVAGRTYWPLLTTFFSLLLSQEQGRHLKFSNILNMEKRTKLGLARRLRDPSVDTLTRN